MQEYFLDYCLTQELSHKKSRHTYLGYARQTAQPQLVIKLFDPECVISDQTRGQLFADMLLSLKHPHIVPLVDMAIKQGKPYVVSEYRAHGSLGQRLARLSSEGMGWLEAMNIVIQIGQALCEAHAHGIIHGNLKPENVFYSTNSEVQLTDFSLTSFIDVAKLDYKSDLATIPYMAPEQFMGTTDQQSDQYSLACLAYELITGRPPFDAASFSLMWGKHRTENAVSLVNAVPEVPMSIDLAVLKALAKKPQERYKDVETFVVALERGLSTQVAGLSSSLQNSSVVNGADTFLLSQLHSHAPLSEQPNASANKTRQLSQLLGEIDTTAVDNTQAASSLPSVEEHEVESDIRASLPNPKLFTPSRVELGYEALRSHTQTTSPLHINVENTRIDHDILSVLDRAEQRAVGAQDRSTGRSAQQAAAQPTEAVPALPAHMPLSHKPTKAYVVWVSVVSLVVILAGTLGLSAFGASFLSLPLHASHINGKQNVYSGTTKTVVVSATDIVHVTPTVHTQGHPQAISTPNATTRTPRQLSTSPIATPTPAGNLSTGSTPVISTPTPTLADVPTPMPTPADVPTSSTTYELVNRNSNEVMDVTGQSTSDGGEVIQDTNNSASSQEWTLVAASTSGYFNLVNVNSGLVLEVLGGSTSTPPSPSDATQLDQWSQNGGENQQWQFVSTGDGYYTLVNLNSQQLADVQYASTNDGAPVIQWPGNGNYNQEWQLVPVS